MKKVLKMVSAAGLLGATLMIAGCGSSDGPGVAILPVTNPVLITETGSTTNGGDTVATTYRFGTSAAPAFTYTIANFGKGDRLSFPNITAVVPTVVNENYADGKVKVVWAGSTVITVELIELDPATEDSLLQSIGDFATVFTANVITDQVAGN